VGAPQAPIQRGYAPTRYREVVLTVSNYVVREIHRVDAFLYLSTTNQTTSRFCKTYEKLFSLREEIRRDPELAIARSKSCKKPVLARSV
jgi:hypothetical protein